MKKRVFSALFPMAIMATAHAQQPQNYSISGKVNSSDGKALVGATVFLNDDSTHFTQTDNQGYYRIDNLQNNKYIVHVIINGYGSFQKTIQWDREDSATTVNFLLSEKSGRLEDVVVNTTRRNLKYPSNSLRLNEPFVEVPQSITVISSDLLKNQQVFSMSDGVIRNVSGVMKIEHWGDQFARINMRGGRASAFRNGMNVTSNWGPMTEDMSFVDRVEVVKGPAGFMMSNGLPTGIYNVVTKRPTGNTHQMFNLTMGSYDTYRATADLDGKLDKAGKVLYRLNIMGQERNSVRKYEYNDRYAIAPVITYKPTDNDELTFEYIYQHAKTSNIGSYYIFSTKSYAAYKKSFTETDPGLEPVIAKEHNLTANYVHKFNDDWKLTTQLSYLKNLQQGSSMWIGYINANDQILRTVSSSDNDLSMKFGQMYLTGSVKTGKINHRIIAGLDLGRKELYYDWNQTHKLDTITSLFDPANPSYGSPSNGYPTFDRSKSVRERAGIKTAITQRYSGLYVQDELGFFDNMLRLTLAGRYTKTEDVSYGKQVNGQRFTPRIGVSATVAKMTSVYGLFDQSFVPQSGIRRDGESVKPVTGNNIEFGAKRDWADGKWGTTLAVYRILQNNQNAADPLNTSAESYIVQFGQTTTKGLEFDIHGEVFSGFNVMANYALTDNKITKASSSTTAQATIGNKVPGYAKHLANVWASYEIQDGLLHGFGANLGYTFMGGRTTWNWSNNTILQKLPDYIKFDGGLFWKNKTVQVTANVMNLMNRYLYSGTGYANYLGLPKVYYYQAEAGRNYRVSVNITL